LNHLLVYTPSFIRAARRLTARTPRLAEDLKAAIELLESNPFAPSLRSHKLKGELKEYWACSAGYDLRIVLRFGLSNGHKAVFLQTVGTHDEVY
jgi:addiction module RelE/StbE family toxin